ncbi:hypothetical protein AN958_07744 [Leucoagaricus sp. SymC.cos]|nr:hypothetical protein AN958_07744 [Leucoagaricus sp. SymC.cos]
MLTLAVHRSHRECCMKAKACTLERAVGKDAGDCKTEEMGERRSRVHIFKYRCMRHCATGRLVKQLYVRSMMFSSNGSLF